MIKTKKAALVAGLMAAGAVLTGCSDAEVASSNISKAADNFEIDRRIVFLNVETGDHEFLVEGKCSISDVDSQLEVTCKTGDDEYKKHFLGKAQDFTYFSEQVDGAATDVFHHRIIIKPEAIIPNVDLNTSAGVGNG